MRFTQIVAKLDEPFVDEGIIRVAAGWFFRCSEPCNFISSGWATDEVASLRAHQHGEEHFSGEPMVELNEFIGDKHSELVFKGNK